VRAYSDGLRDPDLMARIAGVPAHNGLRAHAEDILKAQGL
jgi:hypothetical protein